MIAVAVGVLRRGDRYLVARRHAHDRYGGCWEYPGGKIEPHETWGTAVVREWKEELNVVVRTTGRGPFFVASYTTNDGVPYTISAGMILCDEEPTAGEAHDALRWLTLEELVELLEGPTVPSQRGITVALRTQAT